MTKAADRCMAFLVGIREERPTRARIAKALKRSERTVKRAIAELVEIGWITCEGGGNGTPAKIHALSFEEWILARDSKTAPDVAPVRRKMAPVHPVYKSLGINTTPTLAEPAFLEFIRSETRFTLGGKEADEGTVQRLAAILRDRETYQRFGARLREWSRRGNTAQSWGILVTLAREVATPRKPAASERRRARERAGNI